jgi:AraC-like DNA-binding protein
MTTRANRVADRAAVATAAPTFAAGTVRAMLDALARLGHDIPSLVSGAGLLPADLDDPDTRVSCAAVGVLFGLAQQRRPTPDLHLRLAAETPLGAFPLLDYLIVTSNSVGEGMRRFARHAQLTGAPVRLEIHDQEVPIRIVMDATPYTVYLSVLHLRREALGTFAPEYVSLRETPDDQRAVQAELGCTVRGGAAWSGIALSLETWALPMRRRDPVLQGVLEHHAADILSRLPTGTDFVAELRRVLATRTARGDARVASVARDLGTSARSLQRRLATAGVSYQQLVEQARCDAAERHLAETALSIAEVSWLVGYSEPSAFHRAFKRWRGVSPRSFREQRRAAEAG